MQTDKGNKTDRPREGNTDRQIEETEREGEIQADNDRK